MRILFVGLSQSIHTARWIDQITDQGWDLHLYPVHGDSPPYSELKGVTLHDFFYGKPDLAADVRHAGYRITPPILANPLLRLTRGAAHRLWPTNQVDRLVRLIRQIKPDIIHTMEISSGGGLTLAAKQLLGHEFPPWIIGNWGDEVQFFARLSQYATMLRQVIAQADYFTSECARDLPLARELGFKGGFLPVTPAGGSFDVAFMQTLRQPGATSNRRLILLKGYQDIRGRALFGLSAIEMCADLLNDYRVGVYGINSDEVRTTIELMAGNGIPIEAIPRQPTNADILRLFGQARIYIGVSMSDGISTSLLQAMLMGTFPIQTYTACADEWITHGESGMTVPPQDPHAIAAALRYALTDDALVDHAAQINLQTGASRLDKSVINPKVAAMYRQILQSAPRNK